MSESQENLLIPAEFYFQASMEVQYHDQAEAAISSGNHPKGLTLLPQLGFSSDKLVIPHQVSVGWSNEGVAIDFTVADKNFAASARRKGALNDEDFVQFLFDTRDRKSNRRTNRFCHHFQTLRSPGQARKLYLSPLPLPHHDPKTTFPRPDQIPCHFSETEKSCRFSCWLSQEILVGYDPENVPSLGFYYHIQSAKHEDAYFGVGKEFDYESDPSLWPSLKLVR